MLTYTYIHMYMYLFTHLPACVYIDCIFWQYIWNNKNNYNKPLPRLYTCIMRYASYLYIQPFVGCGIWIATWYFSFTDTHSSVTVYIHISLHTYHIDYNMCSIVCQLMFGRWEVTAQSNTSLLNTNYPSTGFFGSDQIGAFLVCHFC